MSTAAEAAPKPTLSCTSCGVPNRSHYCIVVDIRRDIMPVLGHQKAWVTGTVTIHVCSQHMPPQDPTGVEWVRPLFEFDRSDDWEIQHVHVIEKGGIA